MNLGETVSKLKRAVLRGIMHYTKGDFTTEQPYIQAAMVNLTTVGGLRTEYDAACDLQKTIEGLTRRFHKASKLPYKIQKEIEAHCADRKEVIGKLILVENFFDESKEPSLPFLRAGPEGPEVVARLPIQPVHVRRGLGAF